MEDYREIDERLARVFNSEIVFIVGATRWGTAWVQQCMDAHPEVCCKGEAHFADILFPMLARGMDEYNSQCEAIGNRLQAAGLPGNAAGYTVDDVNFFLKVAVGLVFARWTGDGDYKCIAEKTPEHVLSLEVLEKVMPGCKIVHVVRDGRDEAVSAWDFNLGISRGDFPRKYPSFGDFPKCSRATGAVASARRNASAAIIRNVISPSVQKTFLTTPDRWSGGCFSLPVSKTPRLSPRTPWTAPGMRRRSIWSLVRGKPLLMTNRCGFFSASAASF
jgi:hypothetical protein